MKALWLVSIGVCAAGIGLAQGHDPIPTRRAAPSEKSDMAMPCLLGTRDCSRVSRMPVKACLVTQGTKAQDACAVDGMKLIGKLRV
jgi:hypothetical protein